MDNERMKQGVMNYMELEQHKKQLQLTLRKLNTDNCSYSILIDDGNFDNSTVTITSPDVGVVDTTYRKFMTVLSDVGDIKAVQPKDEVNYHIGRLCNALNKGEDNYRVKIQRYAEEVARQERMARQ